MSVDPVEIAWSKGRRLYCLQRHDVAILHQEVQTYFEQGIVVRPGDTIVDVGANIGLFMLEAYERCGRNARIYAFEPIPSVFEALRRNARLYDARDHLEVFDCGLSRMPGKAVFTFYPSAPALSTAYPDEEGDRTMVKEATLKNIVHMDEVPWVLRVLRRLPKRLQSLSLDIALKRTLRTRQVSCPVTTLSSVIADHRIERVDLLKVDAERSELDVFLGTKPADWCRIQQIVADVHDIDLRLDKIVALFKQHGLNRIAVTQPPTLTDSKIHTVHARR